ncbi:MAG: 50S ribosomal protein L10 [Candidatus Micrarchaeaceae archaeon]
MVMLKAQKVEFVKNLKQEIKKYKVVGIMPIEKMPDRLLQKIRNDVKTKDTRFVTARKNLLLKVLDQDHLKELEPFLNGNVGLLMSNLSSFELFEIVSSKKIKLLAKPNQIADQDLSIEAGETSLQPGQAVTDLKTAGIDVQIQKGKVTISKNKVLVKKGEKISIPVSKALKMLDILPFEAKGNISAIKDGKLLYTPEVLMVNTLFVSNEIGKIFSSAYVLSLELGIVSPYNINEFIRRAFISAISVGTEAKIPEGEVVPKLLGLASSVAKNLDGMVTK